MKVYVSFVLPYLTYCSSVWDLSPHSINTLLLEKFSCLHLRCVPKNSLQAIPFSLQLPSLSTRLSLSKLNYPYFQVSTQSHLSTSKLTSFRPSPTKDLRSYHPSNLIIDFNHTTAGYDSFSSSASKLQNSLPSHIKETTTVSSFKALIKHLN